MTQTGLPLVVLNRDLVGVYGDNAAWLRARKRRFDPDRVFTCAIPLPEVRAEAAGKPARLGLHLTVAKAALEDRSRAVRRTLEAEAMTRIAPLLLRFAGVSVRHPAAGTCPVTFETHSRELQSNSNLPASI